MIRLLVTGNRTITPDWRPFVREKLLAFQERHGLRPEQITLIHGGEGKRDSFGQIIRGLDILAGAVARDLGWYEVEVKADWRQFPRAAGPIRNQKMIDEYKPTHGMVFGDPTTRGTGDCLRRMRKAGIEPEIWERRMG